MDGKKSLRNSEGDNRVEDKVVKEESLPCIVKSEMPEKYILERILKQYRSAWRKLAEYDRQKEKS